MTDRPPRSRPDSLQQPNQEQVGPSSGELPPFLVVGQVVRPHGVRGDLLVLPSSETFRSIRPEGELYLGGDAAPRVVDSLRPHQGRYIVHLQGCDDRSAAEGFRGLEVRIALEGTQPLPEGTYYRWQILELQVEDQAGVLLGTVSEIIETGANDVYVIRRTDRRDLLLPAIESVILKVDLEGRRLIVSVPEGLDSPA